MDFKEYLVSTGVSEEQADAVVKGMPEHKFYLASEEKLDERYDKLKSQKEQAEEQLVAHQKELDSLKEAAKGNEELTQKLTESQASLDALKEESETKLAEQQKEFAIRLALKDASPLDEDIVLSQLNKETIQVTDNGLQGFKEQIESLQENKSFLFQQAEESQTFPRAVAGGNPQGAEQGESDAFAEKLAKYS